MMEVCERTDAVTWYGCELARGDRCFMCFLFANLKVCLSRLFLESLLLVCDSDSSFFACLLAILTDLVLRFLF